jgi:hypothetical protein
MLDPGILRASPLCKLLRTLAQELSLIRVKNALPLFSPVCRAVGGQASPLPIWCPVRLILRTHP